MSFRMPEEYRRFFTGLKLQSRAEDPFGVFVIAFRGRNLKIIATAGDVDTGHAVRWEHVSVSLTRPNRTPSWPEMCYVKNLFWEEEDTVVQFHPPKSEYVNYHSGVLHLWRPIGMEIVRPPASFVGPPSSEREGT